MADTAEPRWVVYLAGPEVFLPEAVEIGEQKKEICARYGLQGVFPLDESVPVAGAPAEQGHAIFDHCVSLMARCNAVIANLTPFRGVSADVGTAVEVGFMYGKGGTVLAYTNVAVDYVGRVGEDGMTVENFGFSDNLMCEGPVFRSCGQVVRNDVPVDRLYRDLRGFEQCALELSQRQQGPALG